MWFLKNKTKQILIEMQRLHEYVFLDSLPPNQSQALVKKILYGWWAILLNIRPNGGGASIILVYYRRVILEGREGVIIALPLGQRLSIYNTHSL